MRKSKKHVQNMMWLDDLFKDIEIVPQVEEGFELATQCVANSKKIIICRICGGIILMNDLEGENSNMSEL